MVDLHRFKRDITLILTFSLSYNVGEKIAQNGNFGFDCWQGQQVAVVTRPP